MKPKYKPIKRHKKSKFDPYINEITEMVGMGLSTNKIACAIEKYFEDIVSNDALYVFIKHRGIESKVKKGLNAPKCEGCQGCYTVTSHDGKSNVRICKKSNRAIWGSVKTSPPWCEERRLKDGKENVTIQT